MDFIKSIKPATLKAWLFEYFQQTHKDRIHCIFLLAQFQEIEQRNPLLTCSYKDDLITLSKLFRSLFHNGPLQTGPYYKKKVSFTEILQPLLNSKSRNKFLKSIIGVFHSIGEINSELQKNIVELLSKEAITLRLPGNGNEFLKFDPRAYRNKIRGYRNYFERIHI